MPNTRYYDDQSFGAVQQQQMPGNDLATLLLTPQAGTSAATKTHTTTLKPWYPQRNIILKKLAYMVDTAYTGTGCSLALDLYVGTTSKGSLTVTATAAAAMAESASDLDIEVDDDEYVRLIALSTTTASDANAAKGQITLTHQERFV